MAVGKGSMARASRAATAAKEAPKDVDTKETTATVEKTAAPKTRAKKTAEKSTAKRAVRSTAKTRKTAANVIEAASEQVMERIVYQESFQVLNREAKPGETFGIGDAMPVYYL